MSNGTVTLSARVPDAKQLTDIVGQITEQIKKVNVPGMPLADIGKLATGFQLTLPDTANWSSSLPGDVTSLLGNFPDPTQLAAPLKGPLGQIEKILTADFEGDFARIQETFDAVGAPSLESPQALLQSLLTPLSNIQAVLKNSEFLKAPIAVGQLFGVDGIETLPDDFSGMLSKLQDFLRLQVGGVVLTFSSIASSLTLTDQTAGLVGSISTFFSWDDTNARFQAILQACGEGDTGLAAQLRAVDVADAAQVETARARLETVNAAFTTFTSRLVRDMAFSEASLALLDTTDLETRLKQIDQTLSTVEATALESLADTLAGLLDKVKNTTGGVIDIGQFKTLLTNQLTQIRQELDKLDPAKIKDALQSVLGFINGPLKKLEEFKAQAEAVIRGALQSVQEAIQKIDLSPLRNGFEQAMSQVETTLSDVEKRFTSVKKTIDDALDEVKKALKTVKDFLLDPENGLKKKLEDLFGTVFKLFDDLKLQEVVDGIKKTVETISQAVVKVEFAPIIDATVEAMSAVTDVIQTVAPLLVTDDLKKKLTDATAFLRQVDFNEVATGLEQTFDEILQSIDGDALKVLKDEYKKVIQAVDQFDPSPVLKKVQQEVFDPLVTELEKVKPAALLQPVQDGYDAALKTLGGFNPTETFSFLTSFFDDLLAKFNAISPAKLLEPIEQALSDIREKIKAALPLDALFNVLDDITGFFHPLIDGLQIGPLLDSLEAGHAQMKTALTNFDPGPFFKAPASILNGIFSQTGLQIDVAGVTGFIEAIQAKTVGLDAKFTAMHQTLQGGQAQFDQVNVNGLLDTLRTKHGELRAALVARSNTEDVPAALTELVDALDPMPVLSPLIPKVERVKAGFTRQAQALAGLAQAQASVFESVDKALNAFLPLLDPLKLLKDLALDPVRKLFPSLSFSSFKELLIHLLDEIDPKQWRAELEPLVLSVQTKLKAVFGDAVFGPLKETLNTVKDTIDLLDISSLRNAINTAFGEVETVIQQVNPKPFIEAIDATYTRILEMLKSLNPAGFIAEIDKVYTEDVIGVVKAISPEELLLPVLRELFDTIKGLLVGLDIEVILKPVLEHLKALRKDLVEGLKRAEVAFNTMLSAVSSGGGASVSASVSVGT